MFKSAHQIMVHGNSGRIGPLRRIVVPGNDIQAGRPFLIIQRLIRAHEVGGDAGVRDLHPDSFRLRLVIGQHAVRIKPFIVQCYGLIHTSGFLEMFTHHTGSHDLIPVIEGMSPESRVPQPVQIFNGSVTLFQPDTERLLAVFTVARAFIFIAHMPEHDILLFPVALRQLPGQPLCILLKYRAVGTGIVAASEFPPAAFKIRSQDLGIPFGHPRRMSPGGGGHTDGHPLFRHPLHRRIQLREVIRLL